MLKRMLDTVDMERYLHDVSKDSNSYLLKHLMEAGVLYSDGSKIIGRGY